MPANYFVFQCGSCGHRTTVNESMRREIHEQGCVLCGASVDASDFSSAS